MTDSLIDKLSVLLLLFQIWWLVTTARIEKWGKSECDTHWPGVNVVHITLTLPVKESIASKICFYCQYIFIYFSTVIWSDFVARVKYDNIKTVLLFFGRRPPLDE